MDRASNEGFERAVEYIKDEDRLLEGEDPGTHFVEDAELWEHVYSELLDLKEHLVEASAERARNLPPQAAPEVGADLTVMRSEATRLQNRLEFWKGRLAELRTS